jgi:hypothetical protein
MCDDYCGMVISKVNEKCALWSICDVPEAVISVKEK